MFKFDSFLNFKAFLLMWSSLCRSSKILDISSMGSQERTSCSACHLVLILAKIGFCKSQEIVARKMCHHYARGDGSALTSTFSFTSWIDAAMLVLSCCSESMLGLLFLFKVYKLSLNLICTLWYFVYCWSDFRCLPSLASRG